jgi:Flp pilus assembly protein TadG
MLQFRRLLHSFRRDERGVFAVTFGIMAVVLVAMGGAVVDYVTLQQARTRAQTALDAATLALQPSINDQRETDETIRTKAEQLVLERLGTDHILDAKIDTVLIDRGKGQLMLSGTFSVETIFVKLIGVDALHATVTSQATQGIANVEVAVAMDVTGSMTGVLPNGDTRLAALQKAVDALVDEILALNSSENYAKVALVPYAQAINAGKYATAMRGPIRPEVRVEAAAWQSGNAKTITTVNNANPAMLTAKAHGFKTNDFVYVSGTNYNTINGRVFQISNVTTDTMRLVGLSTSSVNGQIAGGTVSKCLNSACSPVITAKGHSFIAGELVEIVDATGMTGINGVHTISNVTTNGFTIPVTNFVRNVAYTANSGRAHCLSQSATIGCSHYRFTNVASQSSIHEVTTCITERATNSATDSPPTVTLMGRNYPYSTNGCTTGEIVPLTRDKATLSNAINGLTPGGSTSGSLGILGTWHMLAPKLGYLWPQGSQPAPYYERHLMKAAVIMTDGEFNTVHCNGVVSVSSTEGSFAWSNRSDQINCNAPNGLPYAQAEAYCNAMKQNTGIVVFTVGLGITENSAAADALSDCASSPDRNFLAEDTAALIQTFADIARQISALRLTQ